MTNRIFFFTMLFLLSASFVFAEYTIIELAGTITTKEGTALSFSKFQLTAMPARGERPGFRFFAFSKGIERSGFATITFSRIVKVEFLPRLNDTIDLPVEITLKGGNKTMNGFTYGSDSYNYFLTDYPEPLTFTHRGLKTLEFIE